MRSCKGSCRSSSESVPVHNTRRRRRSPLTPTGNSAALQNTPLPPAASPPVAEPAVFRSSSPKAESLDADEGLDPDPSWGPVPLASWKPAPLSSHPDTSQNATPMPVAHRVYLLSPPAAAASLPPTTYSHAMSTKPSAAVLYSPDQQGSFPTSPLPQNHQGRRARGGATSIQSIFTIEPPGTFPVDRRPTAMFYGTSDHNYRPTSPQPTSFAAQGDVGIRTRTSYGVRPESTPAESTKMGSDASPEGPVFVQLSPTENELHAAVSRLQFPIPAADDDLHYCESDCGTLESPSEDLVAAFLFDLDNSSWRPLTGAGNESAVRTT